MRLFFAAMLPEDVQVRLGKLRAKLEWIPTKPSWSAPRNLHITLKFLGEVADEQVSKVASSASDGLPKHGEPLRLRPARLLFFPPVGSARVLGVGFEGDTQRLIDIQGAIEAACEELGFAREQRAYTPHATLARFRDGLRPVHRGRIEECCAGMGEMPEFTIKAVQLMQSRLSSRGSEYAVVAAFPLMHQEK